MNQLQVFNFQDVQVRTIEKEGQPWFVLKDVCDVLDIDQVAGIKRRLSDDVISNHPIPDALGRPQQTIVINEDGLYDVILESRKPEARAFRKWITSEVLPTIRKTGGYAIDPLAGASPELRAILMVDKKTQEIESRVNQVEAKLDEQITLDHGEARRLQKAIAKRVYGVSEDEEQRSELFRELHREIKDRWGVPSYHDVKRKEFADVIRYIEAWFPRRRPA